MSKVTLSGCPTEAEIQAFGDLGLKLTRANTYGTFGKEGVYKYDSYDKLSETKEYWLTYNLVSVEDEELELYDDITGFHRSGLEENVYRFYFVGFEPKISEVDCNKIADLLDIISQRHQYRMALDDYMETLKKNKMKF